MSAELQLISGTEILSNYCNTVDGMLNITNKINQRKSGDGSHNPLEVERLGKWVYTHTEEELMTT